MKKAGIIFLIIILLFISYGCSFSKKNSNVSSVIVTGWNNIYDGHNIHFYYESKDNKNSADLNKTYKLSGLVKSNDDDFKKSLTLQKWVNQKLKFDKGSDTAQSDAASILKEAENGKAVSDKGYAIVFCEAAPSLGITARIGELRTQNMTDSKRNFNHYVCEIWSSQKNKWILIDTVNGCYMESKGVPQSAAEVLEKGIGNVHIEGTDNKNNYVKDMGYLYDSYTIQIDNSFSETKKSFSSITYIKHGSLPEIQASNGGFTAPAIFVMKDDLFNKSPLLPYKDDSSDSMPTLIFSKKQKNDKKGVLSFYGGAFKNSVNIENYYISIDNSSFNKCSKYFDIDLQPGKNNIRLSMDEKNVLREITIEYKK